MTLARLIASGCGSGYARYAPGTAGSLLGVAVGGALLLAPPYALPIAALLASLGGVWAIRAAKVEGDPGWVVIDEVAGQLVALIGLARPTLFGLAAAFAVFRLLDITKPGPIGWADRQSGAAGIMADDLIAGAFTGGILWAVRLHWPALFG